MTLPKSSVWECNRIFRPNQKVFSMDFCFDNLDAIKAKLIEFTTLEGFKPEDVVFEYGCVYLHNYKWRRPFDGEIIEKTLQYRLPTPAQTKRVVGTFTVHTNHTFTFESRDKIIGDYQMYIGRQPITKDLEIKNPYGIIRYVLGERIT